MSGLEGVVVARTVLSEVDGAQGRLVVRGMGLEELAGHIPYEGIAAHLWRGLSGEDETPERVQERLGRAREEAFARLAPLASLAAGLSPIEALRVGLGLLPDVDPMPAHDRLAGALAVWLAAVLRAGRGLPPVEPDATASQAEDFLRMTRGASASPDEVAALDTYLVTVAEHGMNASTFTARVIASTRAGAIASVVGALGALKGPLHGGAPGPVLDMLDAIGTPDRIGPWLREALARGDRLMGFGHRIYRVRDPRADVLKVAVGRLRATGAGRLAFAEAVESAALEALAEHKPGRVLATNVEFYTALLLEALGIEREGFTAVFALGRVLGWTAHVFEQEREGRLIRPASEYVGPRPRPRARPAG